MRQNGSRIFQKCSRAGSSINKKCARIKIMETIHEFDEEPDYNLGFAHCQELCEYAKCGFK